MRRLIVALLFVAASATARTIHWPEVNVTARLDAEGRLHVREEQRTVFDGDWNGGERTFNLRDKQTLEIERVLRDGTPLTRGDLKQVDHYELSGSELRWRSRLPKDPPFENREITYTIEYVITNVLTRISDDSARLDHDFLTENREGEVTHFTLELTFAPEWKARAVSMDRGPIPPGQTVIVTQDLTWTGSAEMPAERPLPRWAGILIAMILLGGIVGLVFLFFRGEARLGRFARVADVDERWIEKELEPIRPELAGMALRGSVGPNEVGAVLARLTQEGKLKSRVERRELFLTRMPAAKFRVFEDNLVRSLFFDLGQETSTKAIRKHYRGTGFDPAAQMHAQLEGELALIPGWTQKNKRVPWLLDLGLLGAAFVAMIVGGVIGGSNDIGMTAIVFFISVFLGTLGCIFAATSARALTKVPLRAAVVLALFATPVLGALLSAWNAHAFHQHAPALLAVTFWLLALTKLAFDLLRTPESPQRIAFRRKMLDAKLWFREQIASERPRLRDEWIPYLIAFGLGRNVDRWFRAHGTAATSYADSVSTTSSSSASTDVSHAPQPQWTGGGGTFGGAGATGAWAAATVAMAQGVSAPSTSGSSGSSSSSSSSGSSSSGGGSMGGW